jgi:hypothetical protein
LRISVYSSRLTVSQAVVNLQRAGFGGGGDGFYGLPTNLALALATIGSAADYGDVGGLLIQAVTAQVAD